MYRRDGTTRGPLRAAAIAVLALLLPLACGDDDSSGTDAGDVADVPDDDGGGEVSTTTYFACPGDRGCATTGAEAFEVGVARGVVNPTIVERMTLDVRGDGEYQRREGDTFDDVDGDTVFDGAWIAGYGNPRPANEIHDDIETRVLAIRSGDKLLVIVTADLVGLFYDKVEALRARVADLEIDDLLVACSHNHEGPDTIGIWGLDEVTTGVYPEYMASLLDEMEETVRAAVADLAPARIRYGRTVPGEHAEKGVWNVVNDTRDPVILDEFLTALHFETPEGEAIATLVHFTSHPEYSGSSLNAYTADYVHALREGIENGVIEGDTDVPGIGGTALFVTGAVGGQIGPGQLHLTALDGTEHTSKSYEMSQAAGRILAVGALRAVSEATAPEATIDLEWVRARAEILVENYAYHAMMLNDVFDRERHGYDPTYPLETGNFPWIWTEASWLRLGRAQIYTIGGEPFPELFIGGYDGSRTPAGATILHEGRTNPPDLSLAPDGPYLFDLIADADYPMCWGLTNDMLGYLMPAYDFELDADAPFIDEAPGDHYEETNSIGPNGWPTIRRTFGEILDRRPGR